MTDRPFAFLTRRRLLGLTLAAGSATLMGGAGLVALRGGAPPGRCKVLSDREYQTACAIARAQLPSGGPFPLGADDVDLGRALDAFLENEHEQNVKDLKAALLLVEYGPVAFELRATTFSNLSKQEQAAHWASWATSSSLLRRQAFVAFRKLFSVVFFDDERAWPHIGYPGPSLWGAREP